MIISIISLPKDEQKFRNKKRLLFSQALVHSAMDEVEMLRMEVSPLKSLSRYLSALLMGEQTEVRSSRYNALDPCCISM